ncbi:MAG TPA: ATP-binding cassette domain-containing protein, partial [Kribbella sp.]
MAKRIEVSGLNVYYGDFKAVEDVSMTIEPRSVTAFIGPSGCGKSTYLRTLNRMHEVIAGARVEGKVMLDQQDLYATGVDPVAVRRVVGMVFQRPNPFPTMSIFDNVAAGLRLNGVKDKKKLTEVVEQSLQGANLWTEVKDRLDKPGAGLSGGQQQRLCIARAIAVEPEVIPGARVEGKVTLDQQDLYGNGVDPVAVRRVVGMVFQRPNPFPTMSIFDNVASGLRLNGVKDKKKLTEVVEQSLQGANLWT